MTRFIIGWCGLLCGLLFMATCLFCGMILLRGIAAVGDAVADEPTSSEVCADTNDSPTGASVVLSTCEGARGAPASL